MTPPAHYMTGTGSSAGNASANIYLQNVGSQYAPSDGFVDITAFVRPTGLASQHLASNYDPTQGGAINQAWDFGTDSNGKLTTTIATGGNYVFPTSTVALPSALSGADFYLRAQINLSNTAVTPVSGPVSSVPSGACIYSYSTDGTTWTQLGSTITGLGANGFSSAASGNSLPVFGSLKTEYFLGRLYSLLVRKGSGAILLNPDLTKLSSGQTGQFTDTAATPNTWNINGAIS